MALCQTVIVLAVLIVCYQWVGPSCSASALVFLLVLVPMAVANKFCKKRPCRRVFLRMGIPLVGAGAAMALLAWTASPSALFRRYVADPVPSSVQILEGKLFAIGSDPAVFLHFKIAPADLDALLKKHDLILGAPEQLPEWSEPGRPRWWQPKMLPGLQSASNLQPESNLQFGRSYSIDVYADANRTEVFLKLVEP